MKNSKKWFKPVLLLSASGAALASLLGCDLSPESVIGKNGNGEYKPYTSSCTQATYGDKMEITTRMRASGQVCTPPEGAIVGIGVEDKGVVKVRLRVLADDQFPKITALTLSPDYLYSKPQTIVATDCAPPVLSADGKMQDIACTPKTPFRTSAVQLVSSDVALLPRQLILTHPVCGYQVTYEKVLANRPCEEATSNMKAEIPSVKIENVQVTPVWVEKDATTPKT